MTKVLDLKRVGKDEVIEMLVEIMVTAESGYPPGGAKYYKGSRN